MVVDPWGEIVAQAGRGEQVLLADIDLDQVKTRRANMPVLQQRKL
jgi:predicted amidohydrolase